MRAPLILAMKVELQNSRAKRNVSHSVLFILEPDMTKLKPTAPHGGCTQPAPRSVPLPAERKRWGIKYRPVQRNVTPDGYRYQFIMFR